VVCAVSTLFSHPSNTSSGDISVSSVEGKGSVFTFYITTEFRSKDQSIRVSNGDLDGTPIVSQKSDVTKMARMELPLPLQLAEDTSPSALPTSNKEKPKRQVLIVEDNLLNQKLM